MSKTGRIFSAILIALAFLGAIFGIIYHYINVKAANETPSLVVLSCDQDVYYGDDFSIRIAYKTQDGSVHEASDDITYESDNSLVTVDANGKIVVSEEFYELDTDYTQTTVNIKIVSKKEGVDPIIHSISLVPQPKYKIYLDSNDATLSENAPLKYDEDGKCYINAWRGKIVENDLPTVNMANYEFAKWWRILDDGSMDSAEFHEEDKYYWQEDITLRARFKTELELNGDDIGDNTIVQEVFYNETLQELPESVSPKYKGWNFCGWYSAPGGDGILNGVDEEGIFCLNEVDSETKKFTLYAKWEGVATLNLSNKLEYIFNDQREWKGDTTVTGETLGRFLESNTVDVVYHATTPKLAKPEYGNQGIFAGWRTMSYGEGERIYEGEIFNTVSLDLYDCVQFEITFLDADEHELDSQSISAIYGQSLRKSNFNKSLGEPSRDTWTFAGWITTINNEEVAINDYYDYKYIETEPKTVREKWTGRLNLECAIDNWEDSFEITYGEELILPDNISILIPSTWTLAGWYTGTAGEGDKIANTEEYLGNAGITLHAKLVMESVKLEYGNGKESEYIYNLVYGKTLDSLNIPLPKNDSVGDREGYIPGTGWYNNDGEPVTNTTTRYPKSMSVLTFDWTALVFNVIFDSNGGTEISTTTVQVKMGSEIEAFVAPTRVGYQFLGYFTAPYGGKQYLKSSIKNGEIVASSASIKWDIISDDTIILYAHWSSASYCVALEDTGMLIYPEFGQPMPVVNAPTKTGFTFEGYFDDNGKQYYDNNMNGVIWDKTEDCVLKPKWTANPLIIKVYKEGNEIAEGTLVNKIVDEKIYFSIVVSNGTGNYTYVTSQKSDINAKNADLNLHNTEKSEFQLDRREWKQTGTVTIRVTDTESKAEAVFTFKYKTADGCFAAGTQILLDDGTQKPVEELNGDEMLLVWNLYTGTFDSAPILFIDSEPETICEIVNLYFSDGTSVKVIYEHGFWDYNLNEWVFLRNDAEQYIGHWFSKQSIDSQGNMVNEKVQLVNVVITEEMTTAWSPVTFGHLCYYANGLLSMPGATEGFINIFEVDRETLKIDEAKMAEDIEKYGLFTYEDFAAYIPEEIFYAFNGQYLKVSIGKGLMTWDDIFALVDRYQQLW